KTDFYRPEYQKRKDEICPFSSLAFFQPTTVDKESIFIEYKKILGKDSISVEKEVNLPTIKRIVSSFFNT
ncbi:hypothetical protein ACRE0F_09170, partial [Streptococcus pneumoniae]